MQFNLPLFSFFFRYLIVTIVSFFAPAVVIASFDRVRELVANKAMPKIKEMSVPLEGGYSKCQSGFTRLTKRETQLKYTTFWPFLSLCLPFYLFVLQMPQ